MDALFLLLGCTLFTLGIGGAAALIIVAKALARFLDSIEIGQALNDGEDPDPDEDEVDEEPIPPVSPRRADRTLAN